MSRVRGVVVAVEQVHCLVESRGVAADVCGLDPNAWKEAAVVEGREAVGEACVVLEPVAH
jgi:hypothetical protein